MVAEKITQCMKPHGEEGFETISNMNENHKEISEFAFECVNVGNDDKILDIGCGGGVNIKKFLKLTKNNVDGLDYSEVSVKASIKQNQKAVDGAAQAAHQQAGQQRHDQRHGAAVLAGARQLVVGHAQRHHAQRADGAHGDVDVAHGQDQHHAQRHEAVQEVGPHAAQHVGEVEYRLLLRAGGDAGGVGDFEHRAHHDQQYDEEEFPAFQK